MTYAKKLLVIVTLVLSLCAVSMFAVGCGGDTYTMKKGSYEGRYTCTYSNNGETVHAGYVVKFDVDAKGQLWYLTQTAPAADWEGAASDATYTAAPLGQRPWDAGKILGQFDEKWTVNDFMNIKVTVDDQGCPTKIESSRTLTVGVGYEVGTGIVILAVQNAIKAAQ